jgi:cytochrome d ubiquinol oxidase subunit I
LVGNTAETGRQPWVVNGLLRTSDALCEAVTASPGYVFRLFSLQLVYTLLFSLFVFLLNRKIQHGPGYRDDDESEIHSPRLEEMAGSFSKT